MKSFSAKGNIDSSHAATQSTPAKISGVTKLIAEQKKIPTDIHAQIAKAIVFAYKGFEIVFTAEELLQIAIEVLQEKLEPETHQMVLKADETTNLVSTKKESSSSTGGLDDLEDIDHRKFKPINKFEFSSAGQPERLLSINDWFLAIQALKQGDMSKTTIESFFFDRPGFYIYSSMPAQPPKNCWILIKQVADKDLNYQLIKVDHDGKQKVITIKNIPGLAQILATIPEDWSINQILEEKKIELENIVKAYHYKNFDLKDAPRLLFFRIGGRIIGVKNPGIVYMVDWMKSTLDDSDALKRKYIKDEQIKKMSMDLYRLRKFMRYVQKEDSQLSHKTKARLATIMLIMSGTIIADQVQTLTTNPVPYKRPTRGKYKGYGKEMLPYRDVYHELIAETENVDHIRIARQVRQLLQGATHMTIFDHPILPVLTAALFMAESNRNPTCFLSGLFLLDFIENGITFNEDEYYTWKNILWHPDTINSALTAKERSRQFPEQENWGGKHPMTHFGSFEEFAEFKWQLNEPLTHARRKEGDLLMRWLQHYFLGAEPLLNPRLLLDEKAIRTALLSKHPGPFQPDDKKQQQQRKRIKEQLLDSMSATDDEDYERRRNLVTRLDELDPYLQAKMELRTKIKNLLKMRLKNFNRFPLKSFATCFKVDAFVEFRQDEKQLGWNCFDVAIGLAETLDIKEPNPDARAVAVRKQLVTYALKKSGEVEFRLMLAPEIRHAAALTAVYLNLQQQKETGLIDERLNVRIIDLFNIADALQDKHEKEWAKQQALKLLEQASGKYNDEAKNELSRHILPASFWTEELRLMVNGYNDAHEAMRPAVAACNDLLGGQRSLEELDRFFQDDKNREIYKHAYEPFREQRKNFFTPHEQKLIAYCIRKDVYERYVNEYYGNYGWVAFQRGFIGERANTSMVDIVADQLKTQIIIYEKIGNRRNEIYRTRREYGKRIHVQFDNGHFVMLRENPKHLANVSSAVMVSFFRANSPSDEAKLASEQKRAVTNSLSLIKGFLY